MRNGDIKNCPSMDNVYSNVQVDQITKVVEKPIFKQYWEIIKDQIDTCKDCEFRYVCVDCRAFTIRSSSLTSELDWSKPIKCCYDPYIEE